MIADRAYYRLLRRAPAQEVWRTTVRKTVRKIVGNIVRAIMRNIERDLRGL